MKPPTPCEFRRSVVIPARIEDVCRFHGNPHNISQVSPKWQSVRVLEGASSPEPGGEFRIEVRTFGVLPLRWHGIWRVVDEPEALVDEALLSPFATWRHRHLFAAVGADHTRMTDQVTYQFPGGWLGKLFGETLGRLQFHFMFADRHKRTVWAFTRSDAA